MSGVLFALKALDLVLAAADTASAVYATATAARARLQAMKAENRDPTPAEWAELNAEIDAVRDGLHRD